jgi:hypothetical protein
MSKPKDVARVPEDLRQRTDLTLASVARIVHLRKQREKLDGKKRSLEAEIRQVEIDAKTVDTELDGLLATPAGGTLE